MTWGFPGSVPRASREIGCQLREQDVVRRVEQRRRGGRLQVNAVTDDEQEPRPASRRLLERVEHALLSGATGLEQPVLDVADGAGDERLEEVIVVGGGTTDVENALLAGPDEQSPALLERRRDAFVPVAGSENNWPITARECSIIVRTDG
jgi:hypothetical protein